MEAAVKPVLDLRQFQPLAEQLEEDNLEYISDEDKTTRTSSSSSGRGSGKHELKDLEDQITAKYTKPNINKNYGRIYANHHFGNDLSLNAKDDDKFKDKEVPKDDEPQFTYNLPPLGAKAISNDKEPPFAVRPNDPRYYKEEVQKSKVVEKVTPKPKPKHKHKYQPYAEYEFDVRDPSEYRILNPNEGPSLFVIAMVTGISAGAAVLLIAFAIGFYT